LCVIDEYQKSKSLPHDQWAWYMRPITAKKQVNNDDCGVCLILTIYCLVHGLDYCTVPPAKFSNETRLFIFYTVMGFNFDQDNNYDPTFDEVKGTITIVEDTSPGLPYNNYCNRAELGQCLLRAKNPPDREQAHLGDLMFPDSYGVAEDFEEEDALDDDDEDYQQQDMNLK
jgi:hypothetical protein